jgi:hypothetical protein
MTIAFDGFCLDFGRPFPEQIQGPSGLAPDRVRAALAFIQARGLAADGQRALEAQYAVWLAQGATGVPAPTATTNEVLAAANTPPPAPQGTSLIDAARGGQVRVTMEAWQAVGSPVAVGGGRTDHFYGRGRLTAENVSGQTLALFMPVGTVFPPANPAEQNIAGYATSVQVQNTAQFLARAGGTALGAAPLAAAGGAALAAAGWLVRRRLS